MLMMVLITVGIGRLINPLVLGYLSMLGYILLGVFERWEPRLQDREQMEVASPEDSPSGEERRKDSDHHSNV